jgi:hypothetical protein
MKSKFPWKSLVGCGLVALANVAQADERPPTGSLPLSAIAAAVERSHPGVISSAEFDDGWWDVEVCDDRGCRELRIDPRTGELAPPVGSR